jgi:hypothetical protein
MIKRRKIYVVNPDGTKTDINVDEPIKAFKKCRAGNHMYKGFEIPQNVRLAKDKNGEECYLSGTFIKEGVWFSTVCYFMRDTDKYYTNLYDRLAPYFE